MHSFHIFLRVEDIFFKPFRVDDFADHNRSLNILLDDLYTVQKTLLDSKILQLNQKKFCEIYPEEATNEYWSDYIYLQSISRLHQIVLSVSSRQYFLEWKLLHSLQKMHKKSESLITWAIPISFCYWSQRIPWLHLTKLKQCLWHFFSQNCETPHMISGFSLGMSTLRRGTEIDLTTFPRSAFRNHRSHSQADNLQMKDKSADRKMFFRVLIK